MSNTTRLTSIRYVVNISPNIKAIFLNYPQTYLRGIVR